MSSGETMEGHEALRMPLRRLPFWTPGLIFFVGIAGVVALNLFGETLQTLAQGLPNEFVTQRLIALLAVAMLLGGVLGRRVLAYMRPAPSVVFDDLHVEMPPNMQALTARQVSYRDILSVGARGAPPRLDLVVETRRRLYVLPLRAFSDPRDLERAASELTRRVASLPEGAELVEQADRRRALMSQAMTIRPFATQALLGVIVVIFANQVLTDSGDPFGLLRWGASAYPLIVEGEYFRLFSASFLHGGLVHLAFNGLALYVLGSLLERFLGWPRFVLLYLGSGLGATVASAFIGRMSLSVGASGAIFGLLGALAVANWRYRTELPFGLRQPLRWWVIILGLNAALPLIPILLPLLLPFRIDVWAHGAGFVLGAALAAGLIPAHGPIRINPAAPPLIYAAAFGLAALYAVGLTQAVRNAADFDPAAKTRVLEALAVDPSLGSMGRNQLAWPLVTDPNASKKELAVAVSLAERAVADEPEVDAYRDTLATAYYRTGRLDEAVAAQRRVIEWVRQPSELEAWVQGWTGIIEDPALASQLARFLAARAQRDGPILTGVSADGVRLTVGPPGADATRRPVELELTAPPFSGLTAYALLMRGDERLGLVQVRAGRDSPTTSRFEVGGRGVESLSGSRIALTLVLAEAGEVADVPTGEIAWKFWPNDDSIDALP